MRQKTGHASTAEGEDDIGIAGGKSDLVYELLVKIERQAFGQQLDAVALEDEANGSLGDIQGIGVGDKVASGGDSTCWAGVHDVT
ncbi:hypothetical protein FGB62_13g211 [Gracilaria domingensis]|nr:hypothetical protein FGB62_13g211 [Gracilaria domingensis]